MSLHSALLGLISSLGPVSGYDLTKTFRLSMSHYWHARHGQIYPLLEKLHADGLIACQHVRQHDRPNKKLYSITPKGREELLRWLRAPRKPLQMKHEGLLRTRFFAQLPGEEAAAQLRNERAEYEKLRQQYVDLERRHFPGGLERCTNDDQRYAYFTLKRGVMFLDDSIAWCDWSIGTIEQQMKGQASPARKKREAGRRRRLKR